MLEIPEAKHADPSDKQTDHPAPVEVESGQKKCNPFFSKNRLLEIEQRNAGGRSL